LWPCQAFAGQRQNHWGDEPNRLAWLFLETCAANSQNDDSQDHAVYRMTSAFGRIAPRQKSVLANIELSFLSRLYLVDPEKRFPAQYFVI
jgi:hypothetical protein